MSNTVSIELDGFRELEKAFIETVPKAVQRRVLLKALRAAWTPLVDRAKQLAPVRSGGLRDSIQAWPVTEKKSQSFGYAATFEAGPKKTGVKAKAAVMQSYDYYGKTPTAKALRNGIYYALFVEYGTQGGEVKSGKNKGRKVAPQRAQPFLGPAFDSQAPKAPDIFAGVMWAEIEKAAKKGLPKGAK